MTAKTMLVLCAAVVVCCFCIGMIGNEAYAQADSSSSKAIDKDLATKKGVSNSLASGKKDKDKDGAAGPSKVQMGVGIGSCVVAFVVMKYL